MRLCMCAEIFSSPKITTSAPGNITASTSATLTSTATQMLVSRMFIGDSMHWSAGSTH